MGSRKVLTLERHRGRREERRDRAMALHATDRHRQAILRQLWQALDLTGADRGAAVWIDEYGAGVVHPHAVLDLGSDVPRRTFFVEPLRRAWREGVPGIVRVPAAGPPGAARSTLAISLGSDGIRAWFLVFDSPVHRAFSDGPPTRELLFVAGECSGILLHRDLDGSDRDVADRRTFSAWPVLEDAPDGEASPETSRRVACRFVVARALDQLVEEGLAMDAVSLEERLAAVRAEVRRLDPDDAERSAWEDVVETMALRDPAALAAAVAVAAERAEDLAHWNGAAELFRSARRIAAAASEVPVWIDATRALGRVHRKRGEWEEAARWYGAARDAAAVLEDPARQARAMDGLATVHIIRGRVPAAREMLQEAVELAERGSDPDTVGAVSHTLMTLAHTERELEVAARHGWRAVQAYRDEAGRLRALTALGGVLLEARELDAAEDAFAIVVDRVVDRVFRLYALAGLALVAAHRRDARGYRERLGALDDAGFGDGPPELRAEVLLECGDGFLVLGAEDEARRWYERALRTAEVEGVNEYLIRAEKALERLDGRDGPDVREAPASSRPFDESKVTEVRGGLSRMRSEGAVSV